MPLLAAVSPRADGNDSPSIITTRSIDSCRSSAMPITSQIACSA
jgi:hypothetical protein